MVSTNRINWQYEVNLDGVFRGMTADEIKNVIVLNPKNVAWADRIAAMDVTYVRKAVGKAMNWTRRGMRRARRTITSTITAPAAQPQSQKRITFRIAGCKITVPQGVSVEVEV